MFYERGAYDPRATLRWGVGLQKTWHEGTADRDLLIGTLQLRPGENTTVSATALVDWYDSSAVLKDEGLELTRLTVNATHRTKGGDGVGLFAVDLRLPELLRDELGPIEVDSIADFHLTRYGVHGWKELGDGVRLRGRLDRWRDQEDSGDGGALDLELDDLLFDDGRVSLGIFDTGGKFSSGLGFRLRAERRLEDGGRLFAGFDTVDYEQDGIVDGLQTLGQQALRGGYETFLGDHWFLSIDVEHRTGDDSGSNSLGFLLRRRF